MKRIYTFTLDSEEYPTVQFGYKLRLFAHLLYELIYNYDGDGFTPLNINRNIVINRIHSKNNSDYYFDSDLVSNGWINYEPFIIGKRSFGLTVLDDSISEQELRGLINEVLFMLKLNCNVSIQSVCYSSKSIDDESNRRKAMCIAYNNLGFSVPSRRINLEAISQMCSKLNGDTNTKTTSYTRKKVINNRGFEDLMKVSGR